MASTFDYLEYVLEQLRDIENISYRPMMGEYILYYKDKIFGGIYDNRFLIKQTKSSKELLPSAPLEIPYPHAKEMLLVEEIENKEMLEKVIVSMYDQLPKKRKRK